MPLHAKTSHYMPLHAIIRHYMPLHATACHYMPLHANTSYYMPIHAITRHYMPLHATACHYTHIGSHSFLDSHPRFPSQSSDAFSLSVCLLHDAKYMAKSEADQQARSDNDASQVEILGQFGRLFDGFGTLKEIGEVVRNLEWF